MKIGFVGLGRLGFPCAVTMAARGFEVVGYDRDPARMTFEFTQREEGLAELVDAARGRMTFGTLDAVAHCDLVFVAIQTPHGPEYEGVTVMPETRADFDYRALVAGVSALDAAVEAARTRPIVAVISTVLPGTIRREVMPHAAHLRLVYNPYFIAMGTVVRDMLDPEFVLVGSDDEEAKAAVVEFYRRLIRPDVPIADVRIESAELIKVAYNTFISVKLTTVNALMEICQELGGADIDEVTGALCMANRRILGRSYMRGGMGDGGGCHGRDLIAMSWLSQRLNLSADVYGFLVRAREAQTEYLAQLACRAWQESWAKDGTDLPIVILGQTFKPETNLTTGSPAVLLANLLREKGLRVTTWDPEVDTGVPPTERAVYVIGTRHARFAEWVFPAGSHVVDPHRFIADREGVAVVRVGARA